MIIDSELEQYMFTNLLNKTKNERLSKKSTKGNHAHTKESDSNHEEKLKEYEVTTINNQILSIQNIANIYQNQYISRRKGKQTPAIYLKIVENRLNYVIKRHFNVWLETSRNQQVISMMDHTRQLHIKRQVFDTFMKINWQAKQLRNQQIRNTILRPRLHTFNAWVKYTQWCKKYNALFERSVLRVKRESIQRWVYFKNTCFDARKFKRNLDIIRCRETIKSLKRNVMFNKFVLRTTMRTRTKLLFWEASLRKYFFKRWFKYCLLHLRMDRLEDSIEKCRYRNMFYKWKKYTKENTVKLSTLLAQVGQAKLSNIRNSTANVQESVKLMRKKSSSVLSRMSSRPSTPVTPITPVTPMTPFTLPYQHRRLSSSKSNADSVISDISSPPDHMELQNPSQNNSPNNSMANSHNNSNNNSNTNSNSNSHSNSNDSNDHNEVISSSSTNEAILHLTSMEEEAMSIHHHQTDHTADQRADYTNDSQQYTTIDTTSNKNTHNQINNASNISNKCGVSNQRGTNNTQEIHDNSPISDQSSTDPPTTYPSRLKTNLFNNIFNRKKYEITTSSSDSSKTTSEKSMMNNMEIQTSIDSNPNDIKATESNKNPLDNASTCNS